MRICFLGNFTAGGTERAGFAIANSLAEHHETYVLSSAGREPFFTLDKRISFSFLGGKSLVEKNFALLKYLSKNKIDVLVSLEAMSGIISLVPAKLSRTKLVIWEHANYFQTQGSKYIQKLRQIELKSADAYVVLTKRDLGNFKRNFKIKSKITNICNPTDAVSNVAYDISSKTIISVGHIRKIKNFIIIPDIAKLVFKKHPDWRWEIYGNASGDCYEEIKRKVEEHGLGRNVIFCGRSDDMNGVYRKSAMYVMTSLQEGLPMVLLEAKAHKLPLVSFDIETGPDEIIRDGVNGFLVPPYDVEIMAERIISLVENDELRKGFSDNAYLDIEKFDVKAITAKWQELLERSL